MASQDTPSRSQTEAENLIAELCILTEDEEIKTALKKYPLGSSIQEIERKLKSGPASKVNTLKKVLEFLNQDVIKDPIPTKKDDITHAIVCRIQNLLPDDCCICNKRYCLALKELPTLPCAKCGQSSHKQCIVHLLSLIHI